MCELFVARSPSPAHWQSSTAERYSIVDLRRIDGLKLDVLASAVRLSEESIRKRFIYELMPGMGIRAVDHLVWCPLCAKEGRHLPTFQLPLVTECPIHRSQLKKFCPECRNILPYRLQNSTKVALFVCPTCKHDLAPRLRHPQGNVAFITARVAVLDRHVDYLVRMDKLAADIDTTRQRISIRHYPLVLGRPDFLREQSRFASFATNFLHRILEVYEIEKLSETTASLLHIEIPSPKAVLNSDIAKENQARSRVNFSDSLDQQSLEMWTLYRALRRHVSKCVLGLHKRCLSMAVKHLWWDLEGERTGVFCPIALAVIRWRLQWEGGRVPSKLGEMQRRSPPIALVGWSASRPPARINAWTMAFERSLRHHLLASDLLDSLMGWIDLSMKESSAGKVRWNRDACEFFPMHHWACCGGRGAGESGHIFFDSGFDLPTQSQEHWRSHYREVQHQLERIRR